MYRLRLLIFLLFALPGQVAAQHYLYVNTDNLILRDRPESPYIVYDILQTGTRLKRDTTDKGHLRDRKINARFYQVRLDFQAEDGSSVYRHGWVEKQYVVTDKRKLRHSVDTVERKHKSISLATYTGQGPNPNAKNYLLYLYPKYKGGEKVFPHAEKRVYHKGPRGGCFYWKNKRKVYVDARFCK